jgi:uncharacterized protein YbbC (DUF1343 family)
MIELSKNYSVGRGTDAPFEQFGAAFTDGPKLSAYLNQRRIPGVRFYPARFTPASSNVKGIPISGVRIVITNRDILHSTRLGLEIASALHTLYPGKIDFKTNLKLIANPDTIQQLISGNDPRTIMDRQTEELEAFLKRRSAFLLYK